MSAANLVAALNTVEQDHRLVLEKVQALKDVVYFLLDPGDDGPRRALDRLRDLDGYFGTVFEAHMDEEEMTLFPLLERNKPDGPGLAARLRQEHDEIRRKRREFGNCLAVAGDLEDHVPRAVLRDLVVFGWELWEILDNHAGAETRALQRCVTASLSGGDAPDSAAVPKP